MIVREMVPVIVRYKDKKNLQGKENLYVYIAYI